MKITVIKLTPTTYGTEYNGIYVVKRVEISVWFFSRYRTSLLLI